MIGVDGPFSGVSLSSGDMVGPPGLDAGVWITETVWLTATAWLAMSETCDVTSSPEGAG
jgi:hypothetical protein